MSRQFYYEHEILKFDDDEGRLTGLSVKRTNNVKQIHTNTQANASSRCAFALAHIESMNEIGLCNPSLPKFGISLFYDTRMAKRISCGPEIGVHMRDDAS